MVIEKTYVYGITLLLEHFLNFPYVSRKFPKITIPLPTDLIPIHYMIFNFKILNKIVFRLGVR